MTTCLSHNASPYYSVIACQSQSSLGIYFLTLELVSSQAVNLLIEPTLSCVKQLQYASVLLDTSNLVQPVSSLIYSHSLLFQNSGQHYFSTGRLAVGPEALKPMVGYELELSEYMYCDNRVTSVNTCTYT